MITSPSTLPRDRRQRHPLPRVAQRPTRELTQESPESALPEQELRECLAASETDPAIIKAHVGIVTAAQVFAQVGRYRDARALLLLEIGLHCRIRFVYQTGREEAAGPDGMFYARKLRALQILSRPVYRRFRRLVEASPPYDAAYIREFIDVTHRVIRQTRLPNQQAAAAVGAEVCR